MLRYLGAICIFIFTFYSIFAYEKYQKRKMAVIDAFCSFLKFLEGEIASLGRPTAECVPDFPQKDALPASFFSLLAEGASPSEAYAAVRDALPVSADMDACLLAAFTGFSGSRAVLGRSLAQARERYETLLDAERAQQGRRTRLFRTLSSASAMGIVILLL